MGISSIKDVEDIYFKVKDKTTFLELGKIENRSADFNKFPFADKFIYCNCENCNFEINFEIHENGGVRKGLGESFQLKSSWIHHLNKDALIKIANLLDQNVFKVDSEKYYVSFFYNGKNIPVFILFKRCLSCSENHILCFLPIGETYREIATQFLILGFKNIKVEESFFEPYFIQNI
ncbi:hypothetical protein CNR22_12005 [Sphingobacteriaceae bacterium]|nr:hypothetical protein CNR22_12005 [Sphingobacteriaceae bacterium]